MTFKNNFAQPTSIGLFWGVIGGIALILATQFTTNGPLQISPYPPLLIIAILTIAFADKSKATISKLFKTGLLTFVIMTLFLYFYTVIFVNPNSEIKIVGHLWRLTAMTIIGIVSSLIVSIVVKKLTK